MESHRFPVLCEACLWCHANEQSFPTVSYVMEVDVHRLVKGNQAYGSVTFQIVSKVWVILLQGFWLV